jgi:very-short-patch-repair endonuclease
VIERARQLRKKQTWAEKILWRLLRSRRFAAYKFRRQHPFAGYYLDFYCPEAKVVLEIDGREHGFPERQKQDAKRDEFLRSQGLVIKRIWNSHLRQELRWIREDLWRLLQERAPHPENLQPQKSVTSRTLRTNVSPDPPHPGPHPLPRGEGGKAWPGA